MEKKKTQKKTKQINFKRFLKEKKLRVLWTEAPEHEVPMLFEDNWSAFVKDNDEVILVRDLGEWAWGACNPPFSELFNSFQKNFPPRGLSLNCFLRFFRDAIWDAKKPRNDEESFIFLLRQFFEIAINCLGEEEIEKRLKEMLVVNNEPKKS